MPQRGARGAIGALLVARCAAFTIFTRPPRSVTCRFVLERATEQPRQKIVRKSTQTTWDERYRELSPSRSTWGTAAAPLGAAVQPALREAPQRDVLVDHLLPREGRLAPHAGAVYPLEEFAAAMRAKWSSRFVGGCVLHP